MNKLSIGLSLILTLFVCACTSDAAPPQTVAVAKELRTSKPTSQGTEVQAKFKRTLRDDEAIAFQKDNGYSAVSAVAIQVGEYHGTHRIYAPTAAADVIREARTETINHFRKKLDVATFRLEEFAKVETLQSVTTNEETRHKLSEYLRMRRSIKDVIRQVESGAPIIAGMDATPGAGAVANTINSSETSSVIERNGQGRISEGKNLRVPSNSPTPAPLEPDRPADQLWAELTTILKTER